MNFDVLLLLALCGTLSYLVGAIPFGLLVGWIKGVDIRKVGSQNIGATNAGRVLGKKFFFLVLVLDLLKGLLPTLLLPWAVNVFLGKSHPLLPLVVGMTAILGHVFPIYLRFKGGKGVATSAGVFLGLCPLPFAIAFGVWLTLLLATHYMSLASMGGAVALPISFILLTPTAWSKNLPLTGVCIVVALLILLRHRTNVLRLYRGEENPAPLFGHGSKNPHKE